MNKVLLTGGMGYIGSHTAIVLSDAGYEVILFDNLCNSKISTLDKINQISGKNISFVEGDVRDTRKLAGVLEAYKIDSVVHFAGLKSVGESVVDPLSYYDHNLGGSLSLIKAMKLTNVRRLIFSSSATVYGSPKYLPIDEMHPTHPTNPYGTSKLQTELILKDLANSYNNNDISQNKWHIAILRYFNPAGSHDSGLIGEDPNGIPNNLMPFVAGVAKGHLPELKIFGNDYKTSDGTGIRDYIHVMDLAEGHKSALDFVRENSGCEVFNLGTGNGYSVLKIVKDYEIASGKKIPFCIKPRRKGDVDSSYALAEKSRLILNWEAKRTLKEMCISSWKFQNNKEGDI